MYTQPYKILYYNYLNFALFKSKQLCVCAGAPDHMLQMKTNWKLASAKASSIHYLMLLIRSTISGNPFI